MPLKSMTIVTSVSTPTKNASLKTLLDNQLIHELQVQRHPTIQLSDEQVQHDNSHMYRPIDIITPIHNYSSFVIHWLTSLRSARSN